MVAPTEDEARFDARTSRTFKRILKQLSLHEKKVLDIGCGFGEHLRHFGKGSVGLTTTIEEVAYGKKKGISIMQGNAELLHTTVGSFEGCEVIWANNLFEHLLSPHAFLIHLKIIAVPDTLLVLGVPVIPRVASLMRIWKFRGALSDQHINFFTRESLRLTVERAGWDIKMIRPFFVNNRFIDEYIFGPFMPHLYVVAKNNVAFQYSEGKLKEWKNDNHYEDLLDIVQKDI